MNIFTKAIAATGRGLKSFQMRFSKQTQSMWTWGRSRINYRGYVGDGSGSSIVMACVNWICRTFPEAPLQVERRNSDGQWEIVPDHAMTLLLENPNPYYSGALMSMAVEADYAITGNAYQLKVRSGAGVPVQLWWAPSSTIEPKGSKDGTIFIEKYIYTIDGVEYPLDPADVVHHRFGLDPANPRKGRSPLATLLRELFTDDEAAAFTATLLKNLGVPGLMITPDEANVEITQEDADGIREEADSRLTGDGRGSTVVLSTKAKITKLSFSPQEMDLKALRRIPEERVSGVLGIPAIVAGLGAGLDRSTFANMEEARAMAYESNIIPRQRLQAADYKTQLLPDFGDTKGLRVSYDLTQVRVLQDDQDKLYTRMSEGVRGGYVTIAEARSKVGLAVQDSDNVYLRYFAQAEVPQGSSANDALLLPEPDAQLALPSGKVRGVKAGTPARRRAVRRAETMIDGFLEDQADRIAARVLASKGAEEKALRISDLFPADELAQLRRLLGGLHIEAVVRGWDAGLRLVGIDDKPITDDATAKLTARLGVRIKGISDTTRQSVAEHIAIAKERGYSTAEIVRGVPGDGYAGLRNIEAFSESRAQTIARTELATAENWGQVAGWRETGIVSGVRIIDGDQDDACAEANGSTWTLDEFEANPIAHPSCTRVGVPVVDDSKARRNGHREAVTA